MKASYSVQLIKQRIRDKKYSWGNSSGPKLIAAKLSRNSLSGSFFTFVVFVLSFLLLCAQADMVLLLEVTSGQLPTVGLRKPLPPSPVEQLHDCHFFWNEIVVSKENH